MQQLYFAGPAALGAKLLKEGGMFNPVWLKPQPSLVLQSRAHLKQSAAVLDTSSIPDLPPNGVIVGEFFNYYEAIMWVS